MLAHRLRRWPNIKQTLGQCLVFAGNYSPSVLMMSERINWAKWKYKNIQSTTSVLYEQTPVKFNSLTAGAA